MPSRHTVRTVILSGGERLPILLDRASGFPLFNPNIFVLTEYRQRNCSTATMIRVLRELMVLFDFQAVRGINLEQRFSNGQALLVGEIDDLARQCQQFVETSEPDEEVPKAPRPAKIVSLEKARMRAPKATPKSVASTTSANRIRTIHEYLKWSVATFLSTHSLPEENQRNLKEACQSMLETLARRIPDSKGRNVLGQREGLPADVISRIIEVAKADSPENPWRDKFAKARNGLIISWLRLLGVRRGELLNIKISDIDFQKREVVIYRRPDTPDDPRVHQPRVKTRDRIIPLSEALLTATENYIVNERALIPNARKNPFLFVSGRTGAPLSLAALNKLFRVLRDRIDGLPDDLAPHLFRHSWNDEFSRKADASGISEEEEKKWRAFLMGWSPTSSTAAIYTRRHVREASGKASLEMQADMMKTEKQDAK